MMRTRYKPGDWLITCDRTGYVVYASDSVQEWTGRRVRRDSFENRHPQDFVRGIPDDQTVSFARPEHPDVFLGANDVTRNSL